MCLAIAAKDPDNPTEVEILAAEFSAHKEEDTHEPAYTPWLLGLYEVWNDVEELYTAPDKSNPFTSYLIYMGAVIGLVVLTALVLTR